MRYWKPRDTSADKVGVVISSYLTEEPRRAYSLSCLIYSLFAQTHQNWEAVVVHDGPLPSRMLRLEVHNPGPQIRTIHYPRVKQHGHPHRRPAALTEFKDPPKWILFTNDDNYYMPVFMEWLISDANRTNADIAYCNMVHSHTHWRPFTTSPAAGRIDIGSFIVKRELVFDTPWTDFSFRGDGLYFEALKSKAKAVAKVDATLFVHN